MHVHCLSTFPAPLQAAEHVGIHRSADYNSGNGFGAGQVQHNIRGGKRCSTSVAYLQPASKRSNLTILTDVQAIKVDTAICTDGSIRTTGVQLVALDDPKRAVLTASAGREVIVSGGTIGRHAQFFKLYRGDETTCFWLL